MHETGAVLARFDVAQIAIYVFWGFFAGLIWYLRREDHREGYPMVADYEGQPRPEGFPAPPPPKLFLMGHGKSISAPRDEPTEVFRAVHTQPWAGAPFEPTGNPMVDGVGPAAYALRIDQPEYAYDDGLPKIVPLRTATDFFLCYEDPDPRGFEVVGLDGVVAGTVADVWIDRSEYIVRFLEVQTTAALGARRVILPMHYVKVRAKERLIKVDAVAAVHFADVPALREADSITSREEDRVQAYYAGGLLYATPGRMGPLL